MAPWLRQLTTTVAAAASAAVNTTLKPALDDGFSNATLGLIRSNMLAIANASWEKGTAAEALTELSWSPLSVFDTDSIPPPKLTPSLNASDVLKIVDDVLAVKAADSKPLFNGQGSVADPASLGTAVLLANWTRPANETEDVSFSTAASQQLDYLLNDAPRSPAGAISHRGDDVSLWSDFVYMVPPFLAYYGALEGGKDGAKLMQQAYDQISLYRDALRDESGLWKHVTFGNWTDDTHWATGNAWAAAGMLRVLQTFNHSAEAKQFKGQQANLTEWIDEITTAAWKHQTTNGTLLNVIDDSTTFADTSATALLASVSYRMAAFTKNFTQIEAADKAFTLVKDSVDEDGWLGQTVDPYAFNIPTKAGNHSPEGQAFALLLQAAWRDYTALVKKAPGAEISGA